MCRGSERGATRIATKRMSFIASSGCSASHADAAVAIRRCWRFGQNKPVTAYMIASEIEGAVVANLEAKEQAAEEMADGMAEHMSDLCARALRGVVPPPIIPHTKRVSIPTWMTAV